MGRKSRRKREYRESASAVRVRLDPEPLPLPLWLLAAAGLLGVLAGVVVSMLDAAVLEWLGAVIAVLSGGWLALCVMRVAGTSAYVVVPAFAVCVVGALLLVLNAHGFVVSRYGTAERCTVQSSHEHKSGKVQVIDYLMRCPSGEVEVTVRTSGRLRAAEGTVIQLGPFRPVLQP
ncbi:hypothetical protein Lesp02_78910 [Lentzea sp. NBRC 105346]|uniref:hypothetical protein n=1 Tax=Lentzea sp. NBRC 105346 TaxID=3032205 RepID=UPI0024A1A8B9|nr:hypothetical protein [Lentzea sp. NBRC 105346]GLZ35704.1 hypothetical protein Lesp02_78910 [Lentzea sp. NBRC 105346]